MLPLGNYLAYETEGQPRVIAGNVRLRYSTFSHKVVLVCPQTADTPTQTRTRSLSCTTSQQEQLRTLNLPTWRHCCYSSVVDDDGVCLGSVDSQRRCESDAVVCPTVPRRAVRCVVLITMLSPTSKLLLLLLLTVAHSARLIHCNSLAPDTRTQPATLPGAPETGHLFQLRQYNAIETAKRQAFILLEQF